jgi:hypothetical protein
VLGHVLGNGNTFGVVCISLLLRYFTNDAPLRHFGQDVWPALAKFSAARSWQPVRALGPVSGAQALE